VPFGLGQLLLGNRVLYLGRDYATTDCGLQLSAFRAYVRDRYGITASPSGRRRSGGPSVGTDCVVSELPKWSGMIGG
jgi:hypothetical protein